MTEVTIYKNEKKESVGFRAYGHAGYAAEGEDIVCAAISILTINTMNAIEKFTDADCSLVSDDEEGMLEFMLEHPTKEATLLLDTMILGLESLVDDEDYADYIDLNFEEV